MPWRDDPDPYRIWLSEVMLQQTQIDTVIPYYNRWLDELPTIQSVAEAEEDFILKLWEGLGYYARARNFHTACKMLFHEGISSVPDDPARFIQLKGVGEYICAAVQSIAFRHAMPVIDGNVRRILSRILELEGLSHMFNEKMKIYLISQIDEIRPGDFNQALMDLARDVCKIKNPLCSECPIQIFCSAYKNNTTAKFPIRKKTTKKPHFDIAVGIIWKGNQLLISKRKPNGLLGGLWEFPGGKMLADETARDCINREVREELNVDVLVNDHVATIRHAYTHFTITMSGYHCQYVSGTPEAIGCADWK